MKLTSPLSSKTDNDLLLRLQFADPRNPDTQAAWADIVRRWEGRLLAFARSITRNETIAEDAVQETLLELWKTTTRKGKEIEHLKAWLFKLTGRIGVKKAARKRRKAAMEADHAEENEFRFESIESSDASMERQELIESLSKLVESLPDSLRQTVILHFGSGFTQNEIAEITGCKQSTVSQRLRDALSQLKNGVGKAGFATLPAALPVLLDQTFSSITTQVGSACHGQLINIPTSMPHLDLQGVGISGAEGTSGSKAATAGAIVLVCAVGAFIGMNWKPETANIKPTGKPPAVASNPDTIIPPSPLEEPIEASPAETLPISPWKPLMSGQFKMPGKAFGKWESNKNLEGNWEFVFTPKNNKEQEIETYCYIGENKSKSCELQGIIDYSGDKPKTPIQIGICMPNRFNYRGAHWVINKSKFPLRFKTQLYFSEKGCAFLIQITDSKGISNISQGSANWSPKPWTTDHNSRAMEPVSGWVKLRDLNSAGFAFAAQNFMRIHSLETRPLEEVNLVFSAPQ